MKQVSNRIYVGTIDDYRQKSDDSSFVFVLACKWPAHQRAVGYIDSIDSRHPEYYSAIRSNGIALNMVDAESPLMFHPTLFDDAISFMESNKEKNVLICCNQGISRSPSIAMLYLAKNGDIDKSSYQSAKKDFEKLYPEYNPNMGIRGFLTMNWPHLT